jgi:hypothetical protein
MQKGTKWLGRAMVPMAVGVAALCYLAWRPCEPVAHAAEPVVQLPEIVVVGEPPIPVISVEDLPKSPQGSSKMVAGGSRKHAPVCTDQSPEWHCWVRPLDQGTVDTEVQECDCSEPH